VPVRVQEERPTSARPAEEGVQASSGRHSRFRVATSAAPPEHGYRVVVSVERRLTEAELYAAYRGVR
jgi:hypothetical protein